MLIYKIWVGGADSAQLSLMHWGTYFGSARTLEVAVKKAVERAKKEGCPGTPIVIKLKCLGKAAW